VLESNSDPPSNALPVTLPMHAHGRFGRCCRWLTSAQFVGRRLLPTKSIAVNDMPSTHCTKNRRNAHADYSQGKMHRIAKQETN